VVPANVILERLPPYSPELNPQETVWDEIREKIFKNRAAKSMDEVCEKLVKGSLYIPASPPTRRLFHIPHSIDSLCFDIEPSLSTNYRGRYRSS
jgi:DDE superfamily endonuclease